MKDHLLLQIGLALCIIASSGIIASRLKFSIVPLLILGGMVVGPHAPAFGIIDLTFIESKELIDFMGRLGVVFLLFYLGLEFSVSRLLKAGRSIFVGGSIYMVINFTLGLLLPLLAGWPLRECLIAAGIISISSSAIVAKVLVDLKRTARAETEMILGIMLYQDVFVAMYLSIISGMVLTGSASLEGIIKSSLLSLGILLAFILIGRKLAPIIFNKLLKVSSDEVFMLIVFAFLTLIAGLSETVHIAEAIGALMVGLILAETEHLERIERITVPFRDFFGALFFFSFGLSIDPFMLVDAVWFSLIAVIVTLIGNLTAGIIAGRTAGYSHKGSTNIGLTITSRGEFSIVLAKLAGAGGLMPIIQPFSALYVLMLAILGPLLTKESYWVYGKLARVFKWPLPTKTRKKKKRQKAVSA